MITIPSTSPAAISWRLVKPTQINVSEWTGARQAMNSGRGWWECELTTPPLVDNAAAYPWRAFIAQANGGAERFNVAVEPTAQAGSLGTARVNGASQTGKSLNTDGWTVSAAVLKAGQFVTINNQLLQLTADATSNSSGQATISFEPPVRTSPANNALIEYQNPFAVMYLVEVVGYSQEPARVFSIPTLQLREAF